MTSNPITIKAVCYMKLKGRDDAQDLPVTPQFIFPKEQEASVDVRSRSREPVTLRQLLDQMSPADRAAAILCLLGIAGNVDPDEFLDDPANVPPAQAAGCVPGPR